MLGTLGMALLGMVLWQATETPVINGQWTSDEWGTVVLEAKGSGKYQGTFTGSGRDKPTVSNNRPGGSPDGFGVSPKSTADAISDCGAGKLATGKLATGNHIKLNVIGSDGGTLFMEASEIALVKSDSGKVQLTWSRLEHRFNGI